MANGEIAAKCWGLNNVGQLGYGDTANRGDGSNEMGDSLPFLDIQLVSMRAPTGSPTDTPTAFSLCDWYDAAYQWFSNECQLSMDASALHPHGETMENGVAGTDAAELNASHGITDLMITMIIGIVIGNAMMYTVLTLKRKMSITGARIKATEATHVIEMSASEMPPMTSPTTGV